MRKIVSLLFLLFIFSCDEKSKKIISENDSTHTTIDSAAVGLDSSDFKSSNPIETHDLEWIVFNDKNKIPQQIKDFFLAAENHNLEIANPNENFNATDVIVYRNSPSRQLRLLAKKNTIWRMVYIQGGIGKSYQFYEFNINKDTISKIRKGYSFENIETKDSLEYYIKNGKVKFEKIKIRYEYEK